MFGKKIDTDILLPGLYGNKIWALITKRHNGENRGGQVSGLRNNEGEFSDRVSLVVWRGDEGEQEVSLGMCQLVLSTLLRPSIRLACGHVFGALS